MPTIHECNKSIDSRMGVSAVINFITVDGEKILIGKIINVKDGEFVFGSPNVELIKMYEIVTSKSNEWMEFYKLYKNNDSCSEVMFSNPAMSMWIQIRPYTVSHLNSVLRIGFNVCVLNGNRNWQGMGPICTEILVTNKDLNELIESLNSEYVI